MHDEGNDGKFPDESPVEVCYPRSKQKEQADRDTWLWLPGSIVGRRGSACGTSAESEKVSVAPRSPKGGSSRPWAEIGRAATTA